MAAWAGPGDDTDEEIRLCRIEYLGDDDWGFALYDPATETYEPAVLPGGQEAFDAAVTAMLRPRKSPGSLAIATGLTSRSSEAERRRGDVY
jgi:hypothetical protein